ncbi:MAG: hypothetical protein U0270_42930 [Labilithrix sp.]
MKRLGVAALVLGACTRFGGENAPVTEPDAVDAGRSAVDASSAPDARDAAQDGGVCAGAIACDEFASDNLDPAWQLYGGDLARTQPNGGALVSTLPDDASPDGFTDGARIARDDVPADRPVRIAFDVTFERPADYRNHNAQLFSISISNQAAETQYIGIYAGPLVTNSGLSEVEFRLSVTLIRPSFDEVASGELPYGQKIHFELDVGFGPNGGLELRSPVQTPPRRFATSSGYPPSLTLGLVRQNGGTSPLSATYDDFRVTARGDF